MTFNTFTKTIDLGDGKPIIIETGKMAKQADGAVTIKCGDTMLLCTVVSAHEAREGQSFFPLSVDYREKFSAAGRIPGSFMRREARITDDEILTCRLVDRAIRPLFPDGYMFETQVLISVISYDEHKLPEALAGLAASTALMLSDIPFGGPISEVRVALLDGNYIINPTPAELKDAKMEVIVGATIDNVTMVEGECQECSEEELIGAIKAGHAAIKVHCQAQLDLAAQCAKEKRDVEVIELDEELYAKIDATCRQGIYDVASGGLSKTERKEGFSAVFDGYMEQFSEEELEELDTGKIKEYYKKLEKEVIRKMVVAEKKRLDGRQTDEIRQLTMETNILPIPHGSALFTRGETQSLTTVTLGSKKDEQLIDNMLGVSFKKFLLHYNFPPFCTGEVKRMFGPSRREIGHGNLAWRALVNRLPEEAKNPYTVRIVSDVLESNGSSSMATVCAGSLALMDSGLPVDKHVSGIAMGMIADETGYAILSDILGDEDHLGDMDFKVTGTREGITACQMDIKVDGLSYEVLGEALAQANKGRMHILSAMEECIEAPREDFKPHVPRTSIINIDKEFIGAVIGPGGKIIQEIQEKTSTTINLEEIKEEGVGRITIYGVGKDDIDAAVKWIKGIVAIPEVGEIYDAKVMAIQPYGAFVEFMPGKQGLLHISQISWERLEKVEGVLEEGQMIKVKLMGIDDKGRSKLSHKVLIPKPE
ncbi:MAG: polyribonucleotide nucleotidyltransferase [Bacteroidetes bacterium]|nr:polyribonucleotide nucleotidyltransferase [Bacteroidota bacterium]